MGCGWLLPVCFGFVVIALRIADLLLLLFWYLDGLCLLLSDWLCLNALRFPCVFIRLRLVVGLGCDCFVYLVWYWLLLNFVCVFWVTCLFCLIVCLFSCTLVWFDLRLVGLFGYGACLYALLLRCLGLLGWLV